MSDTRVLAVDGLYGHYVPKRFFERFPQFLEHVEDADQRILQCPDHSDYFETWDLFVRYFEVMKDGKRWHLEQDGDLWFVSEDDNRE